MIIVSPISGNFNFSSNRSSVNLLGTTTFPFNFLSLESKNGKKLTYEANMIYRCEANQAYTGMSMTTACPASITAQMIGEKKIQGKGLITMEEIASKSGIFDEFIKRLSERGIKIEIDEHENS